VEVNTQENVNNETPVGEEVPVETIEEETRKEEKRFVEEVETTGNKLMARVKELIAEGNVRRLIIRSPSGRALLEVPLTAGVVVGGVVTIAAPFATVLAALAGLFARVKIEVIRKEDEM
jgi:hypothetical protein